MSKPTDEKQQPAEQSAASDSAAPEEAVAAENGTESPSAEQNAVPEEEIAEEAPAEEAATEEAPDTEAEALRAELAALKEEQEATNDRLLRTAAELQNVRRRAAEEQRRRAASAKAAALRPMLGVLDDLQRALAAAEDTAQDTGAAFQSLQGGVQMVNEKFEHALAELGVEPIEAEGQPFDETEHEAMMQQPAPEGTAPGTVLAEVRRGYRMETNDETRVLRHSRVVVASEAEPAAGEEAEEETAEE